MVLVLQPREIPMVKLRKEKCCNNTLTTSMYGEGKDKEVSKWNNSDVTVLGQGNSSVTGNQSLRKKGYSPTFLFQSCI